jgi:hypothetical protein
MSDSHCIEPQGENIRKAVRWLSEVTQAHPEKKRMDILREAEIRFDLSPAECEFLNSRFGKGIKDSCE